MVVAFGVHSASKEKWKIENLKTENEEKIAIFFTKNVFFFFWNDFIKTTQFLNKLWWHLHSTVLSRNKITQIKVLYNFKGSQSKLLNFKQQKTRKNRHCFLVLFLWTSTMVWMRREGKQMEQPVIRAY